MRSRFTDFLTTDGEKPDRYRDQEFELQPHHTRADLTKMWEQGWTRLFGHNRGAKAGRRHAKNHHPRRTAYRVCRRSTARSRITPTTTGQIVFIAKHIRSSKWKSLSIRAASRKITKRSLQSLTNRRVRNLPTLPAVLESYVLCLTLNS